MTTTENSAEVKRTGTTSTKKQTKLNLDDIFSHSEEEIIDQLQTFSKEFREEFCKILAQTNADKKIISHKAELVSKSYVSCVLDYRSSVIRHAIFAMDVFTQVPRDIVNKERIQSEITRIKDDWMKFKKFYEVIKPLAANDNKDIASLGYSSSISATLFMWKLFGYTAALFTTWLTCHTTLLCNSIAKSSDFGNPTMRKRLEKFYLSTDPNKMIVAIGDKTQKFLWWNKDAKCMYKRSIELLGKMPRQNLRLLLIFNFILCVFLFLWNMF